MASQVKVNGVNVFKHVFSNKHVYATKCNHDEIHKLLDKLYSMYNSVVVTNQEYGYSMLNPNQVYVEITCN